MGAIIIPAKGNIRTELAVSRDKIRAWLATERVRCSMLQNRDILCTNPRTTDDSYNARASVIAGRDVYGVAVLVGARCADAALLGDGWVGER